MLLFVSSPSKKLSANGVDCINIIKSPAFYITRNKRKQKKKKWEKKKEKKEKAAAEVSYSSDHVSPFMLWFFGSLGVG